MQNQYNSCGVVEHDSADIELYIASGDSKKEAFSATTKIRRTSVSSNTRVLVFWKNGSEEGRINRLMDKIGAASDEWKQCARQKRIAARDASRVIPRDKYTLVHLGAISSRRSR
ncbi:hypothetical protein QG37_04087 [Candidozyma auris]|nr:hypothetical protein QG37_04087 [[Candida] auris]